jgi:haloalkane dehalogenase
MDQHSWIDRREYSFESHYLPLEMGRLHYLDEGHGAPIVMVHGNPAWSFLYRHFVEGLSLNHRCIAMDHIGFGLSDKPYDWSYQPVDHARNLRALIDRLELRDVTLVVQDWGDLSSTFAQTVSGASEEVGFSRGYSGRGLSQQWPLLSGAWERYMI